ncbi:MAG TPA: hypothetical protein DDY49_09745 [Paenibacillaceae bacterium]|nr:hypothetical protein [Paenibacillaceae bacterium]
MTTIKTPEEAVKVAQELERVKAVVDELKKQLKSYVDVHGPLDVGEGLWGYHPGTPTWSFDPKKLKEMTFHMAMDGHNPWELLKLTSPSIKKLNWSEDVLAQFGEKKIPNNFRYQKK